jgi:peptidoglycan/LPS O-acetylase OafA/YrhL
LDFVRGLSAMIVVAHHLRACILVDFVDYPTNSLILKLFYFVTSLGHESVMVFFVLSGFFVGGSVLAKDKKFQWQPYLIARLSRLWTVLIPAMLLTFATDLFLSHYSPEVISGEMQTTWRFGPGPGQYRSDVTCALGNVAFLQTIAVPCFGTNFVVWSLANEFWYYILFPILLLASSRHIKWHKRLCYAFVGILICLALPFELVALAPVWLMGVAIWWAWRRANFRKVHSPIRLCTTLLCFLSALIATNLPGYRLGTPLFEDVLVGLSFSFFTYSILQNEDSFKAIFGFSRVSQVMADVSYSLYLPHVPVTLLLAVFFLNLTQLKPTVSGLGVYVLFLATIIAMGAGFWWLFESRTATIRKSMHRIWPTT